MPKKEKLRLDLLLLREGWASSRSQALARILKGDVLVNDVPCVKAGTLVETTAVVRLRGDSSPYVARSAFKLLGALDQFALEVNGKICLDVGASTGGFTQVLLERGAKKVYAVDVGHHQLHWKIRNDPRVESREGVNARYLRKVDFSEPLDYIVMDVSFISQTKIWPALLSLFHSKTDLITLIKPQFEVGREFVGKGGIVTDDHAVTEMLKCLQEEGERLGMERRGLIKSSLKGTHGNQEFLAHWQRLNS